MHSPLAQFEIKTLLPLNAFGFDISLTNSTLFMLLAVLAVTALMTLGMGRARMIPSRWQMLTETIYGAISNMVDATSGPKARPFFPFIFTLFMFIIMCNLLGMIPGSFTVTSHIIVTLALALLVFLVVTITGFVKHGLHFMHLFIPHGTPAALAPVIFLLELFSYLVRPFSLAVRLFANMMAGHILLKVFAGIAVMAVTGLGAAGFGLAILPVAVNIFLIGFEFFVACLQAYIFAILSAVYLRDALEMH